MFFKHNNYLKWIFIKRLTLYSSLIFTALNFSPFGVNLSRADEGSTVTHSEINWSELAIKDVDAAYQLSVINHPGMHDVRNPSFAKVILPIKVYVNRPREKGFIINLILNSMNLNGQHSAC